MWELLLEYERDMKLLEPLDPATAVAGQDRHTEEAVLAMIDSATASSVHEGQIQVTARRQVPASVDVSLSLNFQLPAEVLEQAESAPRLQEAIQAIVQAAQAPLQRLAQQAVQDALRAQAPLAGVETAFRNGRWKLIES